MKAAGWKSVVATSSFLLLALTGVGQAQATDDVLPEEILNALGYRNLPADSLSVYVENLQTGEVVLAWHESESRNPASVMKMVTTMVALDVLGPAYRWQTDVFFQGEVTDGVLDGDLLLRGNGDPFLVTERFWQMLRQIQQAGVREISGGLVLDDSYFQVVDHDPAAFDRAPLRAYNVGPNALLSNFKVVRYIFRPDGAGGVNVRLDPELQELSVVNRLKVTNGSCRGYQRGIAVTMNDALDEVTFSGRFPSGCNVYSMDRTALSHNQFTYSLFKTLWQQTGGSIAGSWTAGVVGDDDEPDLSFRSMPLSEIISRVNKHSNNVMARQLLYTLAAEEKGVPGTEAAGREVILEWIEKKGLDTTATRLKNGAGLSREVRVSAKTLVELLRVAYDSRFMPEFVSSLSLSGLDGTLSRRFRNGELTGRAHMKTGSLDHVTAIAGYFQSRSGERYLVSALQNYEDVHRGPGDEVQAALLKWLNRR